MSKDFISSMTFSDYAARTGITEKRKPLSFYLEITARCNHNCSHCYINLPANDKQARKKEMPLDVLKPIIDEAVSMGALYCNITGGEPLLRNDFSDIYLYLKKKGLMVSVLTNAALISKEHVRLFKKYPPRDLEVTVYGVTAKTYEAVTRKPGSFNAFMNGLELLLENNVNVRLKAMALRSNYHELSEIADFSRKRTKDYFRFDPFLHLRFDRDEKRNTEIISERLTPDEIVLLEKNDPDRFRSLENHCDEFIMEEFEQKSCKKLLRCGAGNKSFYISYDGMFRLCNSLCHPTCVYDLKKGNISSAWQNFVPKTRGIESTRKKYLQTCAKCSIVNLCMWCPAHSDLETGDLDQPVDYFCQVAHKRAEMVKNIKTI